MTVYADLLKTGDREKPGVVPGKPQESLLVKLLRRSQGPGRMPKGKDPLPDPQIKLITDWIAQGAVDDTPASAKAAARRCRPSARLRAAAGHHRRRLTRPTASCSPSPAITKCCFTRATAPAWSPAWSACPSASSRWPSRPTARCWPSPAATRVGSARFSSGTSRRSRCSCRSPVSFDTVYGVSWSPDGKLVAFGCADNTVRAFDAIDRQAGRSSRARTPTGCMDTVFSQDGQHLVSVEPRPLGEADRGADQPLHRQRHEHHARRPEGRPARARPAAAEGSTRSEQAAKMALARSRTSAAWPELATLPCRSGSRRRSECRQSRRDAKDVPAKLYDEILVAGADGQPRLYKMHREVKRVIGDDANHVREYEKLPGRIYAVAFDKTGKLLRGRQQPRRHRRGARLRGRHRQARLNVRGGQDAGLRDRVPSGREGRSPRPASTASCG